MLDHYKKFIIYLNIGIGLTVMTFASMRIFFGAVTTGLLLLATAVIFTSASILLVKMQKHTTAKIFTIFISSFYIYTVQIGVPVDVSSEYFYFPAMMLPSLLFSSEEKLEMLTASAIPFFMWLASIALPYPMYTEPWSFSSDFQKSLQILNFLTAISLTGFILVRYQKYFKAYQTEVTQREKLIALSDMANGVAHEINNPLMIILTKARAHQKLLTEESPLFEKIKSDMQVIISTCLRISRIVNTLLALSRDASSDPVKRVSLATLINETLELTKERMNHQQIALHLKVDESINIDCRPSQISQALLNLIQNSIEALVRQEIESKWIKVEALLDDDHALIVVMDSGTGIDLKIAEKMMTPFFTTKDANKALGLGLSLAYSIAINHNGRLNHSSDSNNTKFELRIPLKHLS